ncbi:hypothetical protein [Streptomyces sp. CB03911]|uniref:hypothetical protein n=1 Tax=Streptomycetaceae TaxID=2062 RepID=UPI00093E96FD|nr:hypothetical protein [Streptomyces sp. CB03911]OKI13282.1 hypothetical protein A6A07_15365 [Streptomyces sp. CB03911]
MSERSAASQDGPAGAAAEEPLGVDGPGREVHYHFPIHVVLVGEVVEEVRQDIVSEVWDALQEALR